MALNDFSSSNVNSKAMAQHLCETDMDFDTLLKNPSLASMAAHALEAWTVRDGFLMAIACDAQDRLSTILPKRRRPTYMPHWLGRDS